MILRDTKKAIERASKKTGLDILELSREYNVCSLVFACNTVIVNIDIGLFCCGEIRSRHVVSIRYYLNYDFYNSSVYYILDRENPYYHPNLVACSLVIYGAGISSGFLCYLREGRLGKVDAHKEIDRAMLALSTVTLRSTPGPHDYMAQCHQCRSWYYKTSMHHDWKNFFVVCPKCVAKDDITFSFSARSFSFERQKNDIEKIVSSHHDKLEVALLSIDIDGFESRVRELGVL